LGHKKNAKSLDLTLLKGMDAGILHSQTGVWE